MELELKDYDENDKEYFERSSRLLHDFWWLIDFKWIDIFTKGIIDLVPEEWHLFLQVLDICRIKKLLLSMEGGSECPASFQTFLQRCKEASIRLEWSQHSTPVSPTTKVDRTSVKKLAESINFGAFVSDFWFNRFGENGIRNTTVVDIGCGLGYVSQHLYKRGFRVVGVDAQPELCETANKRMGKEGMSFVPHFVSDSIESQEFVDNLVPEGMDGILIALHGCGDLLDNVINLFMRSNKFKGLFCVTCCYHKINKHKFPRSKTFRESSEAAGIFFDAARLRCGCQKTPISWTMNLSEESLDIHTKSAAFRGILEEVQVETNFAWKKVKSKMKQTNDLQIFVDQAILGFPMDMRPRALNLLQQTIDKRKESLDRVKTLKILQTLVQPVVESVVVFDHVVKLRENGIKSNGAQVFSQIVSPRNTVVIGLK